jgi:Glycogen recognition site of AMP-activated protein kinase
MGSFVFKWPHPDADEVYVTGTFDDWGKTQKLEKVGDIWEKDVELPANDQKYLYKFVVNGEWVTDHEAPKEDDGHSNVNNVLTPENIKKKNTSTGAGPDAAFISSAHPDSTTADLAAKQPLEKTETSRSNVPGAFPETPMNEPESFGVAPIPASSGIGNPKADDVQNKSVEDSVTTSKEDYDNAGASQAAPEEQTFSAQPIPASSGIGNPQPGDVQANSVHDTVTTSKEDYEKSGSSAFPIAGGALAAVGAGAVGMGLMSKGEEKKNLIPESSLPMGDDAGKTLDASPHIQSAGPGSTTAGLVAGVPLEKKRQAMLIDPDDAPSGDVAPGVPETVKESIAESHQSPEAAGSKEAVKEKEAMEKELLNKVHSTDEAGEPAPTIAAATSETAPASPAVGDKTPGQSSTAAAAIADGAGEEGDIQAPKHTTLTEKTEADNTEYAPPHAAGTAPGVAPGAAAALSDGTEDPTLAEEPAVKMMNQNETGAAPAAETTKTEAPVAAPVSKETPTSATPAQSTPTTAPSSAASKPTETGSATSTPTKDQKKKHRVSTFFKKVFN